MEKLCRLRGLRGHREDYLLVVAEGFQPALQGSGVVVVRNVGDVAGLMHEIAFEELSHRIVIPSGLLTLGTEAAFGRAVLADQALPSLIARLLP